MTDPMSLHCSPSGLFTKRSWADDLDAAGRPVARSEALGPEGDHAFALWVFDRAKTLASELDRLAQVDQAAGLNRQLAAVTGALWEDAEWARGHIDGRYVEAAE